MTFAVAATLATLVAAAAATCNSTSFSGHTCHVDMANLSSPAITSADQCVAACCAATKFTCNMAQWCAVGKGCPTPGCFGGDEHKQPSCRRYGTWILF